MKPTQKSPLERQLEQNLLAAQQQNQKLALGISQRQQGMGFSVAEKMAQQNQAYGTGNMRAQGPSATPIVPRSQWWLAPGNIGDINQVIWDYFFVIPPTEIAPQTSTTQVFTINQVASFTMKEITKAVFTKEIVGGVTQYKYLDPDAPADLGFASGVTITMTNTSSRQLYTQSPVNLDQIGSPTHPFVLPTPLLLQANSSLSVQIGNADGFSTYVVGLAILGYRLRISNSSQIQSQVTCG